MLHERMLERIIVGGAPNSSSEALETAQKERRCVASFSRTEASRTGKWKIGTHIAEETPPGFKSHLRSDKNGNGLGGEKPAVFVWGIERHRREGDGVVNVGKNL
jgi:hypothetical protein